MKTVISSLPILLQSWLRRIGLSSVLKLLVTLARVTTFSRERLTEALVKHAQLPVGIPNPPGFRRPVIDQLQRPERQGQQNLDHHRFKPADQPQHGAWLCWGDGQRAAWLHRKSLHFPYGLAVFRPFRQRFPRQAFSAVATLGRLVEGDAMASVQDQAFMRLAINVMRDAGLVHKAGALLVR